MPGVWLAAFLPAVLIAIALGLERLERRLIGPPHRDARRKAGDSSAEVPRSAPGRQVKAVRMPSRLALAVTSCGVLAVAGVTALALGRSAPAPVPIPLFTGTPPVAVVPAPPVADDIVAPAPVPAIAQQAAWPAAGVHAVTPLAGMTARTTTRPTAGPRAVLSAGASKKVRDRAGLSASSGGKSQAEQSHGGGSDTSPKKGKAKGKKSKSAHDNKGGHKG